MEKKMAAHPLSNSASVDEVAVSRSNGDNVMGEGEEVERESSAWASGEVGFRVVAFIFKFSSCSEEPELLASERREATTCLPTCPVAPRTRMVVVVVLLFMMKEGE
jgi:hypothetical protein